MKERRFALAAGLALLLAMLLPIMEIYCCFVAMSVSAVVAMLMALFGVRFWVRLRLDDMRLLPWRSYQDRHRRCEVLARLGAKYGLIAPLAVMGLHVCLAVLGAMITWKLRKGVCRTAAGWTLAILVLPWIDTLIGWGPADPDCDPIFVVPDYLPFFNEMPELLLASVIQLGVFVAAVRCGWSRPEKCRPA